LLESNPNGRAHASSDTAWLSYLAPVIAFGVVTSAEGYVQPNLYPWVYALKLAAVVACFAIWPSALGDLRVGRPHAAASVAVGLLVFVLWIGIEEMLAYPHIGERTAFDPGSIASAGTRSMFLVLRLIGLVIVVPVMEELFWRSLSLRYLTNSDFLSVPIGEYSRNALLISVAFFAATHTEWLVAAITGLIYSFWVRHTRSVLAVVIAHAVTNAALGIYILKTGKWIYW
jgi:CAAX prenyl protease-like protein